MGTEGGMLVFSPDSIVKQTYEAPIVVTGIKYSEDNLSHVLSDADYLEIPTRREEFLPSHLLRWIILIPWISSMLISWMIIMVLYR